MDNAPPDAHSSRTSPSSWDDIEARALAEGFRLRARYTGDRDDVLGARLVHAHTGCVVDLLETDPRVVRRYFEAADLERLRALHTGTGPGPALGIG